MCAPENLRIHVTGDILSLPNPKSAFKDFVSSKTIGELSPITLSRAVLSSAGLEPGSTSVLVTLPSIENSFSFHSAKGPSSYSDPDIAPILVMIEILDTMEGILWKLIRGQGLAYSCYMGANDEGGLLNFTIYKSPNAFKAFEKAKDVVNDLVNGKMEINPSSIEGAKSGVIYSMVARANTMDRAALQSFGTQVLMNMSASYNQDMLIAIQVNR